jgi:hypothetical protein
MAALVQQRAAVPAFSPAATKYTPNLASIAAHKSTTTKEHSSTTFSTSTEITPEIQHLADSLDINATHLISSPYPDLENQLHLPSLPPPSQLFALALTALSPTRPDYATAPYTEIFNWSLVFSLLRALSQKENLQWPRTEFYVVIFRSKLNEVIDRERLGLLDQMSHQEACQSGGLLKYWFGTPDGGRRNLATCTFSPLLFFTLTLLHSYSLMVIVFTNGRMDVIVEIALLTMIGINRSLAIPRRRRRGRGGTLA